MEKHIKSSTSVLFLCFIVLGVYYPSIFAPLNTIDDPGMYDYLLNTDHFSLHSIFGSGGGNYYRPILIVSYLMDKYVWGLEESFMHLENIVFHLFNTLLVFAVARKAARLQGLRSGLAPLLSALFFAIHPLNAEAVAWVAGRTDLLAGFFVFLSAWLLLRESSNVAISFLAALCMLVGCLAKETAIFFLPAALLLPFFIPGAGNARAPLRSVFLKNIPHFLVFFLSGVAYFGFRSGAFSRNDAGVVRVFSHVGGEKSVGLLDNLQIALEVAGFYLKKMLLPFPLNFGIDHISGFYLPVGVLLFAVLVWLLARRTLASYFFLCAAATGTSALLVPLLRLTWTPVAERYMYIPGAFFITGLTFAVLRWKKRDQYRPLLIGIGCLAALVFAYGTAERAILWQDNLALYRDTVRQSPSFMGGQNQLAAALYEKGENREADAILASFQIDRELINPEHALISKSSAFLNRGDYAGARELLNQALAKPGKQEEVICRRLLKLYDIEVQKGVTGDALAYPGRVRLLTRLYSVTGDPFYLYRLGQFHIHQGERGLAQAAFAKSAALSPADTIYRKSALKLSVTLAAKPAPSRAGGEEP